MATKADVSKFSENFQKIRMSGKKSSKLELRPYVPHDLSQTISSEDIKHRAYIRTKPYFILTQLQFKLYFLESQETKDTAMINVVKNKIEEVKSYMPLFDKGFGFMNSCLDKVEPQSNSETETEFEFDYELHNNLEETFSEYESETDAHYIESNSSDEDFNSDDDINNSSDNDTHNPSDNCDDTEYDGEWEIV
jgi:hypothetical protein